PSGRTDAAAFGRSLWGTRDARLAEVVTTRTPDARACAAITEQLYTLRVLFARGANATPRRRGTALRVPRESGAMDGLARPHAIIRLALCVGSAGSTPTLQADESITHTFRQLVNRASVRRWRIAWVAESLSRINACGAI